MAVDEFNYVLLHKTFMNARTTMPEVKGREVAVFNALLTIANNAGGKLTFNAAISTIVTFSGESTRSVFRAREVLREHGFINYESRKGNQSALYTLVCQYGTQSGTQYGTQSGTQYGTQSGTIPKLKETNYISFNKPNIEDVKTYIMGKGLYVDADAWYDFYESNGWMIGPNPMADWKASLRKWDKDAHKAKPSKGGKTNGTTKQVGDKYAGIEIEL